MKILKLVQTSYGHSYIVFDKVEEITYEKIGLDYVGSLLDDRGNIVQSHFLKKQHYGDAFGGREIKLKMKDNSEVSIKDYWFDCGSYPNHGDFVNIGAGTIEKLKKCYVYYGMNINKYLFESMVNEYLERDALYDYKEVGEWIKTQ